MPKKHYRRLYAKPASTAPPTLAPTSPLLPSPRSQNPLPTAALEKEKSVNELLNELRTSRRSLSDEQPPISSSWSIPAPRTLHPSLNEIFGIDVPPPPLPSPRRPQHAAARTRVAGPPPPPSWIKAKRNSDKLKDYYLKLRLNQVDGRQTEHDSVVNELPRRIPSLPDQTLVDPRSLFHLALKAIAEDWKFHVVYHQHYLHTLRPSHKSLLLSYVGMYNKTGSVALDDLNVLFYGPEHTAKAFTDPVASTAEESTPLDDSWENFISSDSSDDEDVTDDSPSNAAENITHLDFSHLISCHSLSLKPQLFTFLSAASTRWPKLTHLSLAYPQFFQASPGDLHWTRLYLLLDNLPTLTHLSLAGWPYPMKLRNTQSGQAEIMVMLSKLAKKTICLKWIDISDFGIYEDLRYIGKAFGHKKGHGTETDTTVDGLRLIQQHSSDSFSLNLLTTAQEELFQSLISSHRSVWEKYWRGLETVVIRDYRITNLNQKISQLIEKKETEKEATAVNLDYGRQSNRAIGVWDRIALETGPEKMGVERELEEYAEKRKELGRRIVKVIRDARLDAAKEGRGGGGAAGIGCKVLLD